MLFTEVLLTNFLLLVLLCGLGWYPSRFLCNSLVHSSMRFRVFSAVFLGYLLSQSIVAIWITKGITMQWLNFIPFLILLATGSNDGKRVTSGDHRFTPRDLLIPFGMLALLSLYLVKSYAPDFQTISMQPFIDFASYAGSAYAMKIAGMETLYLDKSLFFPDLCGLNLYHFTELWLIRLVAMATDQTDLWITSFVLPAFLNVLVSLGLNALPETRKSSGWSVAVLIFSMCFTQGKLLIFNDYFLLHVLDLGGTKLALMIASFLFLWNLRNNRSQYLSFLLILPQINILLGLLLAILAFAGFFLMNNQESRLPSKSVWLGYGVFAAAFLLFLTFGMNPTNGGLSPSDSGGIFKAIHTFFQYGREAVFNLGFLYGYPFLILAALFRSRKYALLFFPFLLSKIIGKIVLLIGPSVFAGLLPETELIFCLALLWQLDNLFLHLPVLVKYGLLIILLLCAVGATGNALTGFMDFEQIYTLASGSFFYLLTFLMLVSSHDEKYPPLIQFKGTEYLLGVCLILLSLKTFRYQKVLPIDVRFYQTLMKEAVPNTRSIYFSAMHYYPFPLHVKAGIPLLFYYPDAHSVPVTQFDDKKWHGNYVAMHLKEFPFSIFCNLPENKPYSVEQNTLRFIKKFGIQFAWVDQSYPKNKLAFMNPIIERRWISESEGKEFWKINPAKIPAKPSAAPASSEK